MLQHKENNVTLLVNKHTGDLLRVLKVKRSPHGTLVQGTYQGRFVTMARTRFVTPEEYANG